MQIEKEMLTMYPGRSAIVSILMCAVHVLNSSSAHCSLYGILVFLSTSNRRGPTLRAGGASR